MQAIRKPEVFEPPRGGPIPEARPASAAVRSAIVLFLLSLGAADPNVPLDAPAPVIGAVEERFETVYYDVPGRTAQALATSLATRGPEYQGRRFFGLTEWEISVEYRWTEQPAGCTMEDVTIHLAVETHLPRRSDGLSHDAELRAEWDAFVEHLDAHERGHRDLAVETAEAMRHRLGTLRAVDCAVIRRRADQTVMAVMDTYDARHRIYDGATNHGHTQGVAWPRPSDDRLLASADRPTGVN